MAWKLESYGDGWSGRDSIKDEYDLYVATGPLESMKQIMREHEAHDKLVAALEKQQAYLNYLRREIPAQRFNVDDQAKTVNAALALARGEVVSK
jgi:hypothetical protein